MTDQAYDRTPIYPLEKPLCDDINQGFSQADRSLRDTLFALLGGASGFLRGGLQVVPSGPPALSVVIKAGVGFQDAPTDVPGSIGGLAGLSDLSRYKPIILTNDLSVAVPAPPGANSRIDLIEVRYNRQLDNNQSRQFLNPVTSAFAPASVAKTLDFTVDGTLAFYAAAAVPTTALAYKSGVAAVSPTAPATDTGYIALAQITVANGVATIVAANIADERAMIIQGGYLGKQRITATGTYTPLGGTRAQCTVVGAGGGSGGGAATAGQAGVSAGGGSGVTCRKFVTATNGLLTGGAATIGAAGAAGASGANDGTNGGDSSLVINGITILAKGGAKSFGGTSQAPPAGNQPDNPLAGSANFDTATSEPGQWSAAVSTNTVVAGNGGSSPFGQGGAGKFLAGGAGNPGTGFGAGGGGVVTLNANASGGAGTAGYIEVEEWL